MHEKDIKSLMLEYLSAGHCGQENAVTSKELERLFDLKGSEIRQIINTLRCQGNPICSDSTGYYYAETEMEVRYSISHLNSRAMKIIKARNGLIRSKEIFTENPQMTIEEKSYTTTPT